MRGFWRRNGFTLGYGALLMALLAFALLDAFVIPREESYVVDDFGLSAKAENPQASPQTAEITDTSYRDEQVQVTLETRLLDGTACYIAEVRLADPSCLRTALAEDTYGRNIKADTSVIAQEHDAILAVNGDYYGFRSSGYVLRNGVLYRERASDNELLLIDRQGDFTACAAAEISQARLESGQWWQIFSFGPALVKNGQTAVGEGDEVEQAKRSNPRTAIGQIDSLHYVFVVSDGRTESSEGLSLSQLAMLMQSLGCRTAYNLDGGGSSTMVFMGRVVNNPTANGRTISQREVSDIVYIGR